LSLRKSSLLARTLDAFGDIHSGKIHQLVATQIAEGLAGTPSINLLRYTFSMLHKNPSLHLAIGALLRSARKRRQMTLDEVARTLGCTKGAVGNWETGVNAASTTDLLKLARIYGVPVSALLPDLSEVSGGNQQPNDDISHEPSWASVGQRITSLRQESNQTLAVVGRAVGVTSAAVQQWESGASRNLRLHNLDRLARHFGVSIQWLVSGDGPRQVAEAPEPTEVGLLEMFRRLGPAEKDALLSYLNWLASKS
jgi:transcriptional regulator with XRE-family HTH domain